MKSSGVEGELSLLPRPALAGRGLGASLREHRCRLKDLYPLTRIARAIRPLPASGRAIAYGLGEQPATESESERIGIGSRTSASFSVGFSEFLAICDRPAASG